MRGNAGLVLTVVHCFYDLTRNIFADDLSMSENEHAHEKWCNDLAAKFLCIFVLDRFSDFVSDQVTVFLFSIKGVC